MLIVNLVVLQVSRKPQRVRSAVAYLICRARVPKIRAFSYLVI